MEQAKSPITGDEYETAGSKESWRFGVSTFGHHLLGTLKGAAWGTGVALVFGVGFLQLGAELASAAPGVFQAAGGDVLGILVGAGALIGGGIGIAASFDLTESGSDPALDELSSW